MVWRNKQRTGRRNREPIAALQKHPKITSIESGKFISDHAKRQLQRAAWRAQHANLCNEDNIETIDLTREPEENTNPDKIEQIQSTPTVYTATITKLFTRIEQLY